MKIIYLIFILGFSNSLMGQTYMTIGEVFDYDINDEFHRTKYSQPTNAQRFTVTDKYYSTNNDTVFYVRSNNDYYVYPDYSTFPPTTVYVFDSYVDTVYYTNLSNLIHTIWPDTSSSQISYDSIITVDASFCYIDVNGYDIWDPAFETNNYVKKYGRGVGIVLDYFMYNGNGTSEWPIWQELKYYKTNGITCGTPDLTTASVDEYQLDELIHIYPNPTSSYIQIEVGNESFKRLQINDIFGQEVENMPITNKTMQLNISGLPSGVYVLSFFSDSRSITKRIIKK